VDDDVRVAWLLLRIADDLEQRGYPNVGPLRVAARRLSEVAGTSWTLGRGCQTRRGPT
jgi:hypothetical protein